MAKQVKKQIRKASRKSKSQSKNKKRGVAKKTSRLRAKSKVVKKKITSKKKKLKRAAPKVSSVKGKKAKKKVKKLKKARKSKANNPLLIPVNLSPELAVIVGGKSKLPRTEVVKKVWQYIKRHDLQDSKDKKRIHADQNLKVIFRGKSSVDMFELTKLVSKHLRA